MPPLLISTPDREGPKAPSGCDRSRRAYRSVRRSGHDFHPLGPALRDERSDRTLVGDAVDRTPGRRNGRTTRRARARLAAERHRERIRSFGAAPRCTDRGVQRKAHTFDEMCRWER